MEEVGAAWLAPSNCWPGARIAERLLSWIANWIANDDCDNWIEARG